LGLTADWQRVFDLAAELDKAVEIDAYLDRQDLRLDIAKLAEKKSWLPDLTRNRCARSASAAVYGICASISREGWCAKGADS